MKNWKDKIIGVLSGIGIMAVLMSSYSQQNQNGKYMVAIGVDDDKGSIILKWILKVVKLIDGIKKV